MLILGIETSCDETAAAVVENGEKILSSAVSSQIAVHHPYGGVVPELASRKHIEAIIPIVNKALQEAGVKNSDITAIAATRGPGLIGSLLAGFCFAKAYSYALNIPLVGINHLEGHIYSTAFNNPSPPLPHVSLLVSGGHTGIYYVSSHTCAELMGQTRDDAAGEAYDKVAKMLGLGYPGGRVIDELAEKGNPQKISFPRAYIDKSKFDFSFSGIKTAVSRYIQTNSESNIADIAASFQEAVIEVLCCKLINAALTKNCGHISLVGGVAANKGMRGRLNKLAAQNNLEVYIPHISLCGDNAAMIAGVGYHYLKQGNISDINDDVFSRNRI